VRQHGIIVALKRNYFIIHPNVLYKNYLFTVMQHPRLRRRLGEVCAIGPDAFQ